MAMAIVLLVLLPLMAFFLGHSLGKSTAEIGVLKIKIGLARGVGDFLAKTNERIERDKKGFQETDFLELLDVVLENLK